MEILGMAMDFFIAFIFISVAIAFGWGSILFALDEQAESVDGVHVVAEDVQLSMRQAGDMPRVDWQQHAPQHDAHENRSRHAHRQERVNDAPQPQPLTCQLMAKILTPFI